MSCASLASAKQRDGKAFEEYSRLARYGAVCWNSVSRVSCVRPRWDLEPRMVWLWKKSQYKLARSQVLCPVDLDIPFHCPSHPV
jgi:hypothetical protein